MNKINNISSTSNKDYNTVELNAILYYADFTSLLATGLPVTDTCKYFFVYNTPINSAYIAGNGPIYDEDNKYFKESKQEYLLLRDKLGEDGISSFIDNICNLAACGKVSGEDMLKCIHRYSHKKERADAINKYVQYMKKLNYTHIIKDDEGKSIRAACSKYVAHYEESKGLGTRPELLKSNDEINA